MAVGVAVGNAGQGHPDNCIEPTRGPVLGGVDVVAYFALPPGSSATLGIDRHNVTLGEYTFHFASAENAEMFASTPTKCVMNDAVLFNASHHSRSRQCRPPPRSPLAKVHACVRRVLHLGCLTGGHVERVASRAVRGRERVGDHR